MLESPFHYETTLTQAEFQKLGELALRWSHIENIAANCLKTVLRLSDEEATVIVFPMPLEQRITKLNSLAKRSPLDAAAQFALSEFITVMRGVQFVRNNVAHAIVTEDEKDGHVFHLRSKGRSLTKAQVFASEELTNYAIHAALSLRYALGFGDSHGERFPLPDRPEIPEFLRELIPTRKKEDRRRRSRPPSSLR